MYRLEARSPRTDKFRNILDIYSVDFSSLWMVWYLFCHSSVKDDYEVRISDFDGNYYDSRFGSNPPEMVTKKEAWLTVSETNLRKDR